MDLYDIWEIRRGITEKEAKQYEESMKKLYEDSEIKIYNLHGDDEVGLTVEERVFDTRIEIGSIIKVKALFGNGDYNSYYGIVRNVTRFQIDYVCVSENGYIVDKTITLDDIMEEIVEVDLVLYPPQNKKSNTIKL